MGFGRASIARKPRMSKLPLSESFCPFSISTNTDWAACASLPGWILRRERKCLKNTEMKIDIKQRFAIGVWMEIKRGIWQGRRQINQAVFFLVRRANKIHETSKNLNIFTNCSITRPSRFIILQLVSHAGFARFARVCWWASKLIFFLLLPSRARIEKRAITNRKRCYRRVFVCALSRGWINTAVHKHCELSDDERKGKSTPRYTSLCCKHWACICLFLYILRKKKLGI